MIKLFKIIGSILVIVAVFVVVGSFTLNYLQNKDFKDAKKWENSGVNFVFGDFPAQNKTYKLVAHTSAIGKIKLKIPDDWSVYDQEFKNPFGLGNTFLILSHPQTSLENTAGAPYLITVSILKNRGGSGVGQLELLKDDLLNKLSNLKIDKNEIMVESNLLISSKKAGRINFINLGENLERYRKSIVVIDSGKDMYFFWIGMTTIPYSDKEKKEFGRDHEKEIGDMLNSIEFLP